MADELPPEEILEIEDQPKDDDELPPDEGDKADEKDSEASELEVIKKRLKDTQAAFTRKSQENSELKNRMSALEGKLEGVIATQHKPAEPKPENPFSFLDDEKQVETLLEDPKNVANAFKRVLGTLPDIFERRDKVLISEMKKMFGSVATDEGREVAAKVARMRQDSDYEAFSDEQLATLVKKSMKAQAAKKDKFRGGVGGSGGGARADDGSDDELEASANDYFKRLYGNSLDEPKKK